jgi:hypothetical protein
MFGKFFDTSHVSSFASEVVRQLAKDLPPAVINDESKKGAKRRQLDKWLLRKIDQFKESVQLNIYQKAKIGPLLQDALHQAGYPADFSKAFSYEVVKLVAVRSSGV